MRKITLGIGAALLCSTVAIGQDDLPASELDLLSQGGDNPFAGVVETQKRVPISVTLRALDKITARHQDIEIGLNEMAQFGSLEIVPRTCDKRPPEEFPETTAFLEIFDTELTKQTSNLKPVARALVDDEIDVAEIDRLDVVDVGGADGADQAGAGEQSALSPINEPIVETTGINIFRGWMYASSPALNALEHGVYDVWVIDCKTSAELN